MYESFFGLSQRPFSAVPHPDEFVSVETLQDALDAMIHCVSNARGIAVITSAPGMGKTIVCKKMASLLQQEHAIVYLSVAACNTRRALLQAILYELRADYEGLTEQEARLRLINLARESQQSSRSMLLIIDEAHLLNPRLFEELRSLADYAPEGEPLFRLVLCGQFELEEKLTDPSLSAFNQRIGVQICLEPLTLEQSARFLAKRLQECGCRNLTSVLSEGALEAICRASDGNLRCLAQLTDHSFLLAFAEEQCPVEESTVLAALEDLRELPLHWNDLPGSEVASSAGEEATVGFDELADTDEFRLPEASSSEPEAAEAGNPQLSEEQADPVSQWEGETMSDDVTVDDETEEFEIPDFLRETEPAPEIDYDDETKQHEASIQAVAQQFEQDHGSEDVPFAVIEVGAGIDPEADEALAIVEKPQEVTEQPVEAATAMMAEVEISEPAPVMMASSSERNVEVSDEVIEESGMLEMDVIDRYTLLDRMYELPEDRRSSVDLTRLNDAALDPSVASRNDPPSQPLSEEELLETVREIRREIVDVIERAPRVPRTDDIAHSLTSSLRYDRVEPVSEKHFVDESLEVTERDTPRSPVEESEPATGNRRFQLLFTRLRERRKIAESEQAR